MKLLSHKDIPTLISLLFFKHSTLVFVTYESIYRLMIPTFQFCAIDTNYTAHNHPSTFCFPLHYSFIPSLSSSSTCASSHETIIISNVRPCSGQSRTIFVLAYPFAWRGGYVTFDDNPVSREFFLITTSRLYLQPVKIRNALFRFVDTLFSHCRIVGRYAVYHLLLARSARTAQKGQVLSNFGICFQYFY